MAKAKDLTNQVFGYLTALKRVGTDRYRRAIWLMRCDADDCGREIEVSIIYLISKENPKKHCGCLTSQHRRKDLTSQVFGYLTALNFVKNDPKAIWLMRCDADDCGREIEVPQYRLTHKTEPMTHCGCLTSQHCSIAHKGLNITHGQSQTTEYRLEQQNKRRENIKNSLLNSSFSYTGSLKASRAKLDYCAYCGSTDNLSTDHIIPIAKGGNNDLKNLVTACLSCNFSKNDSFFIDWYLKTNRCKRSLNDILKDMGFNSILHLQNYQDSLCPEHIEKDSNVRFHKLVKADSKDIDKLLDLL